MNAQEKIKAVLRYKRIKQKELAERMGRPWNTIRNALYADGMNYATFEAMADAIDCDIALIDRETGMIYR